MRKLLLFIITLLPALSFAQYSNDWIPFSPLQSYSLQEYFKVPVVNEGVYRINKSALVAGLVSVANNPTFDHRRFQIFHKGIEQYIYVYDENQNNILETNDYIEFYAKPNDGSLDAPLYNDPSSQANPNYSLINDTSTYYLTWVTNTSPPYNTKRLQVVNDTNFQNYSPSLYFLKTVRNDYVAEYRSGSTTGNEDFDMEITATEGWFDYVFKAGTPTTKNLSTPNVFSSGPQSQLNIVFVGASNDGLQFDHKVKIEFNSSEIATIDYDGYEIRNENYTLIPTSLQTTNAVKFTALNPTGSNNEDKNALSFISLTYPHSMSFAGESEMIFKMTIPFSSNSTKTYLEMTGLSGSSYYIYDFTDNVRIPVVESSGLFQALISNAISGSYKEIGLFSDASTVMFSTVKAVNSPGNPRFRNFAAAGMNHDFIIITHTSLLNSAEQYRIHRSNSGHNPIVVNIDELYGQFIYGVNKHPLAIRNFVQFVLDKWSASNKHMFLLGKALHAKNIRHSSGSYSQSLVPSLGNPPSDVLLSTRILPGKYYTPAIATGRIAANNDQQVIAYLNKVNSYENQQPAEWMKKVLHFGGGSSAAEQQELKNYLTEYANIITKPYFGAHVDSVYKTSSEPIQINQSEYIRAQIDSGVTLMTFFGHSSANSFDVATDHPSLFNNKDRYHFVLANGCYAGDIHQLNESVASEDFVLIPNKGAIGFLAHTFTEFAPSFYPYSKELYNQVSKTNYGGTIGHSIKNTIDTIELPLVPQYLRRKTVCLGMTLHGDPAIVLNSFQKPDFTVGNISFSPENITTELTDFAINVEVKNIGKATDESFIVKLSRLFTDGSEDVYVDTLSNVYNTQIYSKVLPVDAVRGPGLNIFEMVLDTADHVDEMDPWGESNNIGEAQIVIQSNDVTPVYPYEFDIVPVNVLQLKATTANPFDLTPRNYIFEIDTTDAFNSPVKQQQIVISGGGVVSTSQLTFNFEQVYYWRVTLDDNGTYKWRESSFICKANTTGWSQAHFYQYKKDEFYGVNYNKPVRKFDFVTVVSDLFVINSNNPFAVDPAYTINNVSEDYGACHGTSSIHIVVLDSLTHRPWEARFQSGSTILNPNNNFGNINDFGCPNVSSPRTRADKYFIFRANDPAQLDSMVDMITNDVPDGNYIIAYSVFNGVFSTWQNHVYEAFEDLGADSIRYLADNQPYIFFTQKGNPNTTEEVIGISSTNLQVITLNKTLTTFWDRGYVESTRIGPATSWTSLHWQHHSLENPPLDSIHLDVIGIDNQGNESVLISGIQPSTPVLNLSSTIQASAYPYLKLRAVMKDTINRTPPQLDYWQIYYEGVPELALNPSKFFEFYKDTVQHGESIKLAIALENISSYNTPDSVLIDHYVYNRNKVRVPISSVRHKPLASGDTLVSRIEFSSIDFPELNSLWIEANPNNDQPEQYHFNNLGELKFYALRDVTNPILDVTFDGVHILNGDIVSAKPHIVISLKDENKYLAIEDTSSFAVFLIHPDGRQEKLYFESSPATSTNNNLLKWYPASLPKNSFKIEFLPYFPVDGKYELRVQAKDQSDNISGLNEYRIGFEIINKSTITNILNYPNPFSTSTRFVFTLTGSEIPTYFKIQILTVTGKIIREITSDELGPLRIGRNITEYAWNGTDEYGDKLANGLYLYRVITQIHGANIERRETDADVYFRKNFGKMYILR